MSPAIVLLLPLRTSKRENMTRANFVAGYVKRQKKKSLHSPQLQPKTSECLRNWDSKGKYHVLNVPKFEKAEFPEGWIQQAERHRFKVICIELRTKPGRMRGKCQGQMPMASDNEKRHQDVRGPGGHVQDKGMERRAAIWIWSRG